MQPLHSKISHPPDASSPSPKKPHIAHVEARSCKRNFEKLGSDNPLAETKQGFEKGSLVSGSKSKIQVANVDKNPSKKRGFVVKPGACVDSESKEPQGCLFESMALRTCPICNTTLNAHIVKCLPADSGQEPISKPSKPRVKPRMKIKTMVDIYAAAKGCTLEDLNERNGTKWAVISEKNKPEVCNKRKKRSGLHVHVVEDAAATGPVYIDDKCQKLRIISEFNEKGSDSSREHVEDVIEKKSCKEGKGNYRSFRNRLGGKKYYKHCKGNASEILEYQRGYSEKCRGTESSGPTQCIRIKKHLGSNICDQPLSADPLVSRGLSHASADLSERVSSSLNSQNSWRRCGESQVSGKIAKRERCSMRVDMVFASDGKSVMKVKKEEEDEDSGRWESEMTQERVLTDIDDHEETDTSTSGGEDNDYESWEETGNNNNNNNKGDGIILDKKNDANADFERGGSTFMEVDDPIPIPGPPGSFLQSPWDIHHGNFSVITSHVKSSQDQLDLTDRNSSESAISNFAAPETQTFSLHNVITTVPAAPSYSNSVLRLMGKDLVVINQRGDTSHGDSSLKPTPQFQDLSRT